jgi:DNA-binding CsgD family transcriptional regulator
VKLRNNAKETNLFMYCISSYLLALNISEFSPVEAKKMILEYLNRAHLKKLYAFDFNSYRSIGNFEFKQNKYSKARYYWIKASKTKYIEKSKLYLSSIYNDISLSFLNQGKTNQGLLYLKKAIKTIKLEENYNHSISFYNHLMCNLADIYITQKEYQLADKVLTKAYYYYKNNNIIEINKAATILIKLSDFINLTISQKTILNDLNLALNKNLPIESKVFYVRSIYQLLSKEGSENELIDILKLALNVEKELSEKTNNHRQTTYLSLLKSNFDNLNIELKNKLTIQRQKNNVAYLITIGVIIIGVIIFIYFRRVHYYSKKILQQAKCLEESQKEIYRNQIRQKEEQIEKLQLNLDLKKATERTFLEKIKEVKKSKNVDLTETLKELQIQVTNLLQIDKRQTESSVENTDQKSDFMERLMLIHPNLSKGEIQLCNHLKLNLNSKEIALIEGLGHASIRVYKTNLKRKLNLSTDQNIYDYLNSI